MEQHSGKVPPVCAITSVKHVTIFDIVSTRMLGAAGFLAHIFNQFLKWNVSIDVIATSEVSVSCTVNSKDDMSGLVQDLRRVADVNVRTGKLSLQLSATLLIHLQSLQAVLKPFLKKESMFR